MTDFPTYFPIPEGAVEPAEVRFTELRVEPWPDGKRVRVHLSLTPFLKLPNLETFVFDQDGVEIASASIIETMNFKLVFTLHLRTDDFSQMFYLISQISYIDLGVVDEKKMEFRTQVSDQVSE